VSLVILNKNGSKTPLQMLISGTYQVDKVNNSHRYQKLVQSISYVP